MRRGCSHNGSFLTLICIALIVQVAVVCQTGVAIAKFDPVLFIERNTSFFPDFKAFREHWFAVEDRISGIQDEYQPVDWFAIRESAKQVVIEHERLTVKFARDCRSGRSKVPSDQVAQVQRTIEIVQEYLDSVGLVVLKLYEIADKLHNKTLDPYSYTMSDYNADMRQFRELYKVFQSKGSGLNRLFYGE